MRGDGRTGVLVGVILLYLALRVPLLLAREPFFDELLTVWYAKKPVTQHWSILVRDSGSPLYTAVARACELVAGFTVGSGRILSMIFGLGALILCFRLYGLAAAAALAAYPAHVFFSTEARAYSLAAMLIGVAALCLYRWNGVPRSAGAGENSGASSIRWLIAGTLALVLAAYTHSYGVLFFPLPFVLALLRRHSGILHGLLASAAAGVLFLPGFWLASQQPLASIDWMRAESLAGRLWLVAGSFLQLGYAAPYQPLFLTTPHVLLQIVSALVVGAVVIAGVTRSESARFFAVFILVPIAALFAFAAAGRTFYFPTRFESTLSVPFALLLASALLVIPRKASIAALTALVAIGSLVAIRSAAGHTAQPSTPYRIVAEFISRHAPANEPLVASGYAYLELISATDERRTRAFPSEQAVHPGWIAPSDRAVLRGELGGLPARFVWMGVAGTAEAQVLEERFSLRMIFNDGRVVAALAEEKS
ncbi:MAG TPA: hypothetical protein VMS98_02480 [Thermoanaerobaculia bacterium]|nr:hypothetical protein [Thermoanaerobaculia bacterium]